MLSYLKVENLGIVDSAELDLSPKLNALSGESGSGKSLVVDALLFVAGAHRFRSEVRPGKTEGHVTAQFHLDEEQRVAVSAHLEGHSIPLEEEFVLSRQLDTKGRSRCFIQGRLVPRTLLAAVAAELIEMTAQGDGHALKNAREQLILIDDCAGLSREADKLAHEYGRLQALREKLSSIDSELMGRELNRDFLSYQRTELGELPHFDFDVDERRLSELEEQTARTSLASSLCEQLSGPTSLSSRLTSLARQAEALGCQDVNVALSVSLDHLRQAERALSAFEVSDFRVEKEILELKERKSRLLELARKYRLSPEELGEKRLSIEEKLARLDRLEEERDALAREVEAALTFATGLAEELHEKRVLEASALALRAKRELGGLGLGQAEIRIELSEGTLGPHGTSQVQFSYTPHPSTAFKPLGRVASGGEIGRVLLALRLASGKRKALLVLDEIDAGVGGNAAHELGECLGRAAELGQILFISHWAQVAAQAETHFRVTKTDTSGTPTSRVDRLTPEMRLTELSRMLGGDSLALREHAASLIDAARRPKSKARGLRRVA